MNRPSLRPAQLQARLEASRQTLMDAIAGLDEQGFRSRPAPSEWSVAEVLSHLLSSERYLVEQAGRGVTEAAPWLPSRTDAEREPEARAAQRMAVPQILHGLLGRRRETLTLLADLSPAQLERPLRHEQRGHLDVAWLFQHIAEHEAEHAAQIRAARPRMTMPGA